MYEILPLTVVTRIISHQTPTQYNQGKYIHN